MAVHFDSRNSFSPFGHDIPSFLLCLFVLSVLFVCSANAQENRTPPATGDIQLDNLSESLEQTIASEKQENIQLKAQLERLQQSAKVSNTEINAYKVQVSAYSNLLHQEPRSIEELKKARAELQSTLQSTAERLSNLKSSLDESRKLQHEAKDQYEFNKEQLTEIESGEACGPGIIAKLKTLDQVLSEKLQIIAKIESIYLNEINQLTQARQSIADLAEDFDQKIEKQQTEVLFDRKENPFSTLEWERIPRELQKLTEQASQLYSLEFWTKKLRLVWKTGGFLLIKALLLFGIAQFLLFRLRRFCASQTEQIRREKPWLCFTLNLFQRSLPLLGTVLFIYCYAKLQDLYSGIPVIGVAVNVLLIWLVSGWFLDFLALSRRGEREWIPHKLSTKARFLMIMVRLFAIPYIALQWVLGGTSSSLLLARVLFELGLIIWSMVFWRTFRVSTSNSFLTSSRPLSSLRIFLIGGGYTIAIGGLILELSGYGQLALYWYASWGRTLALFLWAFLVFYTLREWDQAVSAVPVPDRKSSHHFRWLLIRLLWVGGAGTLAALLLVAWGARRAVLLGFFSILNHTIRLGEMRFNLLGVAYAFLIVVFTLVATRLWREILKKRILEDSGLELGLQESIATLSVYVLWGFGALAALHAMGVGTTSLAVAFGALGIGLGFGLQNIFNNFISGLILLFERPIQVGEVIEIGGHWGVVKKINFRSTLVQTYDNASLIIPNSEFISNQVVNWSFKDPRLRRSVTVGVAYGSDIELVRSTLLEIAEKHPQILKYPRYDVLFTDFGDSALVFTLRFWATLDYFFTIETEIRFEIDRIFREKNIEISFPQRDIHIRSVATGADVELKNTGEQE